VIVATSIIGVIFALMFCVLSPSAIALVTGNPQFVGPDGAPIGGPNMVSIHLSTALGGPVLEGIVSAVAFATILAVVAGLVMATASAASHDLYSVFRGNRQADDRKELRVFRLAAGLLAIVSMVLAFGFRNENVAFLSALAFAVASSANFPVLILILYWRRLTVTGALSGGLIGLVTSVTLIVLGPAVWVKILGHDAPIFPSDFPGLLVAPITFAIAIGVSLMTGKEMATR
jgi:cation/acetate symporter